MECKHLTKRLSLFDFRSCLVEPFLGTGSDDLRSIDKFQMTVLDVCMNVIIGGWFHFIGF
jgi:hypothetical protein